MVRERPRGQLPGEFLARYSQPEPEAMTEEDRAWSRQLFDADSDVPEEARRLKTYGMASWTQNYLYTQNIEPVKGLDGRSDAVSPWEWLDASQNSEDHGQGSTKGLNDVYPATGYSLDYDLQYTNQTAMFQAFRDDMYALREREWFTNRTRAIIVTFSVYNGNFDLWTYNEFVLEFPANGIVVPTFHIRAFSPTAQDSEHGNTIFYVDTARLLFALYIMLCQIWMEVSWAKQREEKYLFTYLINPYGIADVLIVLLEINIYVQQQLLGNLLTSPEDYIQAFSEQADGKAFWSLGSDAGMYNMINQMEAPLFCLLAFRFFSMLRINRQIYVVWCTMVQAAFLFIPFLTVLFPIGVGLTVWAHCIWHNERREFTQFGSAGMSLVMMSHGDIHKDELFPAHRPETLVFGVCMYIMVWLIIVNTWIAVLVHIYEKVRVAGGYKPSDYRWKEKHWVVWVLWKPLASFYFRKLRPHAEKPNIYAQNDDDD
jgi:hypothetical protein